MNLRSRRTIFPIEAPTPPQSQIKTSTGPSTTKITKKGKDEEKIEQQRPEDLKIGPPPFPERLNLPRPIINSEFGGIKKLLCQNSSSAGNPGHSHLCKNNLGVMWKEKN